MDPMVRTLTLGVIPTVAPYLLRLAVGELRRRYARLRLLLREAQTGALLRDLDEGRVDAALLAVPIPTEGLQVEELFAEPFYAALPADHPVAKRKFLTVEDLPGDQLLLLEDGHCLRDQALSVCRRAGGQLLEEIRATSLKTLRQMVGAAVAYTLMPAMAVPDAADGSAQGLIAYRPPA
jgi:LysR family hydrogen peroxide-inducible transcriptional activator